MSDCDKFQAAASQLLKESGCTVRRYRKQNSGVAYTSADDWGIEVPEPTSALRFAIFAHEVGHQMSHRHNSSPRWLEEWEAWDYALRQFDRFDLPSVDVAMKRAAKSLRYAAGKAERRSKNPDDMFRRISAVFPAWVWFA